MNYFHAFRPVWHDLELTKLQRTIIERADQGVVKYTGHGAPEITAPLASVAAAVESAYILTPKDELPRVTPENEVYGWMYRVEGLSNRLILPHGETPSEARKRANAWLAVAAHLDREEKAKAAGEAKAKAAADAAARVAEAARARRLDELADEWFGYDFADLSPNNAAAIKEIHRLETKLEEQDKA